MYKHHSDSLQIMKEFFYKQNVIALVFGGSVAKGNARPDSDLDAIIIVPDDVYQAKLAANNTAETINGMCTYEGGYFDIKYKTKQILKETAENGSEPARNAFLGSKVLFSHDPEIDEIAARIPIFQKSLKEEKMLSFYSNFWLNYFYFLKSCPIDGYMKLHVIGEIIYSLYRIILQEKEILFACNRRLEEQVQQISQQTAEFTVLGKKLAMSQNECDADIFVDKFKEISTYIPPENIPEILSAYTKHYEEWWNIQGPFINEW